MSTLEKAVEIAARAHAGQRDKAGAYLLHFLPVYAAVYVVEFRMRPGLPATS